MSRYGEDIGIDKNPYLSDYGKYAMQFVRNYGITLNEATEAIRNAMRLLPPPGEKDILLIKANQTLNWFQKCRLIRNMLEQ